MKFLGWILAAWIMLYMVGSAIKLGNEPRPADNLVTGSIGHSTSDSGSRASTWDEMREDAVARVSIKQFSWSKGGFGSVLVLNSLTIYNGSKYKISDLNLQCRLQAESGTVVSEPSKVLYISIPPKKSKTLNDINVGFINDQAQTGGCWISGVSQISLLK